MPQKPKGRNPRVSKGAENPQCHIHDNVGSWRVGDIRQNVCVNDLPLTKHTDGKHYCLFHLPTQDKDKVKFEEIFRARLKSVNQKVAEIEELPEEKQQQAKYDLLYDFRFVWFPSRVKLDGYKFQTHADFRLATFSSYAEFSMTIFPYDAFFMSATFLSDADFTKATFLSDANFAKVTFSAYAHFNSATFSANVDFIFATFSNVANFNATIFLATVNFGSAKFLETSQIFFRSAKFCGEVDFRYTTFAGYVAFEGKKGENVFLNNKEKNQVAVLNLQDVRLENPERISFHRVRLRPNWFVNVDSRKVVFTDIRWDNLDAVAHNANIEAEKISLSIRKVSEPSRLLEIACRQLGVNAEENNRYEEASKFRYMAMETKRLEYRRNRFLTLEWWYRFSSGYGENWRRAAAVLLGVLLFFGLLYATPLARFDYGAKDGQTVSVGWNPLDAITCGAMENSGVVRSLNVCEGLTHSLYVAALQRPEPKAADTLTRFFIILETIFAPLQAALLALAIRRKFMR